MALINQSQDYERGGTQKDAYSLDDVVVVSCPLCGSGERTEIHREYGVLVIAQCRACSLLYTSPRVKAPEQVYWGDGETYYEEARMVFEGKAAHHRDPNYLEELALIKRYKPAGRFLDVGCNMGMLLRHVRRMGWTPVGVEPSPAVARLAIEKFGLEVHNCFLHEVPDWERGSFDVIALSDVFEHVTDPIGFLTHAGRLLAPDGILYIKVPNARWNALKQATIRFFGGAPNQKLWDSYEHVVHYTDRTLAAMLDRAGFDVVKMTIARPVQLPAWHEHVGRYYLHASPPVLDWKRHLGRSAFYWLSWPERVCRGGSIGAFAPNIVAIARKRGGSRP
jgi:SAM-dependent methyltransferase